MSCEAFYRFVLVLSIGASTFVGAMLVAAMQIPRESRFRDSVLRRGLWIALAAVLLVPVLANMSWWVGISAWVDGAALPLLSTVIAGTIAGLALLWRSRTDADGPGDATPARRRLASEPRWMLLLHGCFACVVLAFHGILIQNTITHMGQGGRLHLWSLRAIGPFAMFRTDPIWLAAGLVALCGGALSLGVLKRRSTLLRRLGYFALIAWFYCGGFGTRDLP